MSTELSIVPFRRLELEWEIDPAFIEKRDEAVGLASLITVVNSIETNQAAAAALKECGELRRLANEAYDQAMAPLLSCVRSLQEMKKSAVEPLIAEEARLSPICGNYVVGVEAQQMSALLAAEATAKGEENALQEALSKTSDVDERQRIREEFMLRAQANAPIQPMPVRAKGQSLKPVWEIEIENVHELCAWCVRTGRTDILKVEVRKTETVQLLDKGVVIDGIKAERINKTQLK